MKEFLKRLAKTIPSVKRIFQERDELRISKDSLMSENAGLRSELDGFKKALWVPPGHFYSPYPSLDEIRKKESAIFRLPDSIPAVNLNEGEQLKLMEVFAGFYKELPFQAEKTSGLRYHFNNPNYSYSDGICLYSMIRHAQPKRIVEIGSGFSSCVTLDTNELFFSNKIDCTFIEPYPELLLSLMKEDDKGRVTVIPSNLQEVNLEQFKALQEDDILFIDSTHVSKINSDVNYIFFEILPVLNSGVYIHIHDIFYPFEYPKGFVYQNRCWTEDYVLHAFLQYNDAFKIVFFNTFLQHRFGERFEREMPLCLKNRGGSIWLKKV